MTWTWITALIATSLLLIPPPADAGPTLAHQPTRVVLSIGDGKPAQTGIHSFRQWYAVCFDVVFRRGVHEISPRISYLFVAGDLLLGAGLTQQHGDIGLLYGRTLPIESLGYVRAAAGLGLTRGEVYNTEPFGDERFTTIGFPWMIRAVLPFGESAGIGFGYFGNINDKNSFSAWGINVAAGF